MKEQNDDISNPATTWSDKNHPKHRRTVAQAVLESISATFPRLMDTASFIFHLSLPFYILLQRQCQRQLKAPERGEWPVVLEG